MANPFNQVVKGQRIQISAAVWNALLRMLRDSQGGRTPAESLAWGGVIEARALNSTGGDLREYRPATVTAAGGYDLPDGQDDWQRNPAFTLGVPASSTDFTVVTLEAIPDGSIGRVAICGAVLCDVHINSSGDKFASPTTNTTALESASTGTIRILHKSTSGSTRQCVVYLGDQVAAVAGSSAAPVSGTTLLVAPTNITTTGTQLLTLTIPSPGTYLITAACTAELQSAPGGYTWFSVDRVSAGSGSTVIYRTPFNYQSGTAGGIASGAGACPVACLASDTIRLFGGYSVPSGTPTVAFAAGQIVPTDTIANVSVLAVQFETRLSYQRWS